MSAFKSVAGDGDTGRKGRVAPGRRDGPSSNSGFGAVVANPISSLPSSLPSSYQEGGFRELCARIETDLKRLTADTGSLSRLADSMAKGKATQAPQELQATVDKVVKDCTQTLSRLTSALNKDFPRHIEHSTSVSDSERTSRKAQLALFKEQLAANASQFREVGNRVSAEARRFVSASRTGVAATAPKRDAAPTAEEDRVFAHMQRIELNEALIDEREQAVDAIAVSVNEVNMAFREVAGLVAEQAHGLTEIERNTEKAQENTAAGVEHLKAASKYQGKYRKCLLIFLAIVLVIAAGLTAYFVISNKNK